MPRRGLQARVLRNLRKQGVKVYTRRQWGSRYPHVYAWRLVWKRAKPKVDTLVQHITVTLDHGPLSGHFKEDVRTVERIGYERFKSGISYNFVVDMTTGEVAMGMPLKAKGTHTVNDKGVRGFSLDQNYWARAIAVLGMPHYKLSEKAERSLVAIGVALVEEGALYESYDYCPHSMFAYKDCPCDATRSQMHEIRRRVRNQLKARRTK